MIKTKCTYIHKTPNYIKRSCILLVVIISFFAIIIQPTYTYCATSSVVQMGKDLEQDVNNMLDDIDFAPIEELVSNFDSNQLKMFSLGNVKAKIKDVINGEQAVDYATIMEVVLQVLMQLIIQYVPMFALIIGIGVIASLLGQIKSKFAEKSTSDIIHFVCFCLIVVIMATSVKKLISNTTDTLNNMKDITNQLFPIMLTLMAGIGSVSSVGVFKPILAVMSNIISTIIFKAVIPIFILM